MSTILRLKFWILCGLMVVVALAGFFFVYMRQASKNAENLQTTVAGVEAVESTARAEVRGTGWDEALDEAIEALRAQEREVTELVTRGTWEVIIGEVIDWRGLALKVAGREQQRTSVGSRIFSMLPAELADTLVVRATAINAALDSNAASVPVVAAATKMDFLDALNGMLERDDFYDPQAFGNMWLLQANDAELSALAGDVYVNVPDPVVAGMEPAAKEQALQEARAERASQVEAQVARLKEKQEELRRELAAYRDGTVRDIAWFNRLVLDASLPRHVKDSGEKLKFAAPFEDPALRRWGQLYEYEGLWRPVYQTRVDEVYNIIQRNFLGYGGTQTLHTLELRRGGMSGSTGSIGRTDEPTAGLTRTQMEWNERAYWIQRYIVRALAAMNSVPRAGDEATEEERVRVNAQAMEDDRYTIPILKQIRFDEQPERLLRPSHNTAFVPQALTVTVIIRDRYLNQVMEGLKDGVPTLEVTGYRSLRFGRREMPRVVQPERRPRLEPGYPGYREEEEFEFEFEDPMREEYGRTGTPTIAGLTMFPFGRWQVPRDAQIALSNRLIEVALSVYVKDGDPDAPELELRRPASREDMPYDDMPPDFYDDMPPEMME